MKIIFLFFALVISGPLTAKLETPPKDETALVTTPKPAGKKRPLIKRLYYKPTNNGRVQQYKQLLRRQKLRRQLHAKKIAAAQQEQQS